MVPDRVGVSNIRCQNQRHGSYGVTRYVGHVAFRARTDGHATAEVHDTDRDLLADRDDAQGLARRAAAFSMWSIMYWSAKAGLSSST